MCARPDLGAALRVVAVLIVLIALNVLRRTSPPAQPERTGDRDLLPAEPR
ncbi:hypothetical protein [Streptomyces herbicida]|nr:hypothetical protein [Streptomyces sp. NEAU-HV9]